MVNVQGVLDQVRVCVVIPVHNEAKNIGPLVKALRHEGLDVVVVDDGSTDQSGLMARHNGAVVLTHDKKQGKGRSLLKGFGYALERDYDGVLTMDGDGQHDVHDIPQFMEQAKGGGPAIITGNRMHNPQGMPGVRLWTNRVMSVVISFLCRQKIPDTQCGFRLISCAILRQLQLTSCDFEIETEVLMKASKKGFKIVSIPVRTIYWGESSKINPFFDTIRFFAYLIKEALARQN